MLHRLALRVLPQVHSVVTDAAVRRRKRWVMLVPGLVAFGIYRLATLVLPLSDPFVLLTCSGMISTIAALWAYRMGRGIPLTVMMRPDERGDLVWIGGWIGFVYGVQLSLLVLALLKIMVNYDFFLHPDGPAMMAIVIACTSVTRDAFEIGHLREVERRGQPIPTLPRGHAFRQWMRLEPFILGRWLGVATLVGGTSAFLAGWVWDSGGAAPAEWLHALVMSMLISCVGLAAFFAGESRSGDWLHGIQAGGWWQSFRFWVWPCWTFAMTYYLVCMGILFFVLHVEPVTWAMRVGVGGLTAAVLVGYSVYLGRRKLLDVRIDQDAAGNVQRCPFVMEILAKARATSSISASSLSSLSRRPDNVP